MGISNLTTRLTKALESSIRRFPLTVISAFATCITIIIMIEQKRDPSLTLQRLTMIFALSIPITLSFKLMWERKGRNLKQLLMYYLSSIILIIAYYFIFLNKIDYISTSRFIGTNLIFYLLFLFIPYFLNRENFEMYSIKIFTGFFITAIYTLVLFLGLSAILFTIDSLLGIKVESETYIETWFVCLFIFAVNYFLSLVPKKEDTFTKFDFPRAFNILLNYIVIPLLSAYTVILYIYFFKIIITQNWPKGLVSHLVLWYSFITILVVFFIHPIKEDVKIAYYFTKIITKIIIPLIIMMFFSMGIRINAYGVTEPRYYVIVAGIWILFVFIYWNITKQPKNTLIPSTLALTIFISLFTPLSSFSISRYSQNKRFENLLIKNNILKDGKIQKNPNINKDDQRKISSIISYFETRQGIDKLKYVPKDFNSSKMSEIFGFNYETPYFPKEQYFYYRIAPNSLIDIKGYDYFIQFSSYNQELQNSEEFSFKYYNIKSELVIFKGNKEVYRKNISEILQNAYKKYSSNRPDMELKIEELSVVDENEALRVKIILNNVSGRVDDNEDIRVDGCDFLIMYSIRK
ncbi:MAG: rane protein [Caloramator sp.]|jgi:hypothetical protein|uniref:DUF4153 domain-containing protein n=1 Tax=Caloramator sp. TaxID=1871330 RepID=UPI001DA73A73|nr:DUF4153 domain-containing protein [Caloramator sp.]MBZ4664287.1 rane protein [Caloramator sp.]